MAALPTIEELCAAIIQQSQNDTSDIGKKRTALIRRICKYNVEGSKLYPILLTKYFANTTFTAKNEDIAAEEYILAGLADGVIRDMETRIQPEFIALFNSPQLDASGLEVFLSANPITDVNIIVDIEDGYTPLVKAVTRDNYTLCKILYLYGADPNYIADGVRMLPLIASIDAVNKSLADHLLDWGANPNLEIEGKLPIEVAIVMYDLTHNVLQENYDEQDREDAGSIIELLIIGGDASVPRNILVKWNRLELLGLPTEILELVVQGFIQDGGNINEVVDGKSLIEHAVETRNFPFAIVLITTPTFDFTMKYGDHRRSILFIAASANMPDLVYTLIKTYNQPIDKDVQEGYDKRTFSKSVLDVLDSIRTLSWKGFTQSDITKLNSIFEDPAVANNYALCPVCLQYVERSEACMYMKHDCSKGKNYHRGLYNMYKNAEGLIGWCTICGRISAGHRHYELGAASSSTTAQLRKEMYGAPFEKDCSKTNGGGGLDEKLARFYRFREYALELQDDIGIKTTKEAWDELVEETWNAPLARQAKLLGKLKAAKTLGNASNFPANVVASPGEGEETVYADVPLPEGFVAPTKSEGTYPGYPGDTTPLLTFHHQPNEHTIPEEEVVDYVEEIAASFAHEHFGDCVAWADGCVSRLYPEEIKDVVPANVYETYKKSFNRKFGVAAAAPAVAHQVAEGGRRNTRKRRKMRGGSGGSGEESMIIEASDAVCDIPPRANQKGGRRTRNKKTNANAKKAKKTKASRRR